MSLKILNEMLFPEDIKCIVCGDEFPAPVESGLCPRCGFTKNATCCPVCGRGYKQEDYSAEIKKKFKRFSKSLENAEPENFTDYDGEEVSQGRNTLCSQCRASPFLFTKAVAPFIYEGDSKHVVRKLKYGSGLYLTKYMAAAMAAAFNKLDFKPDFIVFAPMSKKRQASRGYNQAEKLAYEVGKLINVPVANVLDRVKDIKTLARLSRRKRLLSIQNSIKVLEGLTFSGQSVLFIDDVFTTGATSGECAKQLLFNGAKEVYILTFATSYALKNHKGNA